LGCFFAATTWATRSSTLAKSSTLMGSARVVSTLSSFRSLGKSTGASPGMGPGPERPQRSASSRRTSSFRPKAPLSSAILPGMAGVRRMEAILSPSTTR
jgi:hypothetical protein